MSKRFDLLSDLIYQGTNKFDELICFLMKHLYPSYFAIESLRMNVVEVLFILIIHFTIIIILHLNQPFYAIFIFTHNFIIVSYHFIKVSYLFIIANYLFIILNYHFTEIFPIKFTLIPNKFNFPMEVCLYVFYDWSN